MKHIAVSSVICSAAIVVVMHLTSIAGATAPPDARSFEELRADVLSMKEEQVPWRAIQWKTCLLDGLRASREQAKPLMLWIFIDLPIDDERC